MSGVPLVLVPGLGLDADSWAPTVRALEARRTIDRTPTTVLLPGYGHPGAPGDPVTPEALARTVLAQLPTGRAVLLVALSAGCQVAAHVALQAPERVAGLVLVGPTTDPRAASWSRLARRWLVTASVEPRHQLPALLRQYRRTGPSSMFRAMDAARRDRLEVVLPRVGCPVLTVRGQHDAISPDDWHRSLTGQQGDGAAVVGAPKRHRSTIATGAHMVPFTHGADTASLVAAFVALLRDGGSLAA